jgi:copper chaperone CopZ
MGCNQDQVASDQQTLQQPIQAAQTISISISGMDCEGCVKSVSEAVRTVEGVEEVVVSLDKGTATVKGTNIDLTKVFAAVDDAGYGATLLDSTLDSTLYAKPDDSTSVQQ